MEEHPIEGLMITAMNSIQDMVDVNTIVGEPIETNNNITIIPISKVCFGFAAGGSEFKGETIDEYSKRDKEENIQYKLPFGGGSGAGVNINPVAFLVIQENSVKLLPVSHYSAVDKLLDYVPDLFEKIQDAISKAGTMKTKMEEQEETEEDIRESFNIKKRPKKHVRRTNPKYEFEYDDTKPDAHIDEDIDEYMNNKDD